MKQKLDIAQLWNESLEQERYEVKERNYINASDIGKSMLDRFYKMKGIPETNPYDYRVLRIFAAGNEFHHLLKKVFEKIGILIDSEQRIEIPATEKTLKIVGYYDLNLGGKINTEQAEKRIKEYEFSFYVEQKALRLAHYFKEKYPQGFEPTICEIKSVHSNAFWSKKYYLAEAYPWWKLQIYTYLKALNISEGRLFCISKDDLSLIEYIIRYPDKILEEKWVKDVEAISNYYLKNIEPPKEPEIIFNETKKKYVINWMLARSPYFTKITGFTDTEVWGEELKEKIKQLNKSKKVEQNNLNLNQSKKK